MMNWGSAWRGIKAMKLKHNKVVYAIDFEWFGKMWFHMWTPIWHEGRGPYITTGFYFVRFIRGY